MREINKKSILCFVVLILFLTLSVPNFAQAQKAAVLQGETKTLMPGDAFEIPVTLSNNPGIMGCMITIGVDETNLVIDSVENGELTEDGLFDYNLGLKAGTFDILWSHTEDISEDGVLFYLKGRVAQNAKQDISIPLSYSQPDTFNEEYEDVQIKCEKIIIPIEAQGKELQGDKPQSGNSNKEDRTEEITAAKNRQEKEESDQHITNLFQKVERKKVAQTIQKVLDKYKQKDFSSANKKNKKKIIKEACTELKGLGVEQEEIKKITKEDSLKEQGDFFDRLYQEAKEEEKNQEIEQKQKEQQTKEQKNSDEKHLATKQIVLLITFFAIGLSVVLVVMRRKK